METVIRKTYTIYNKEENRIIRTYNYLEEAKEALANLINCEIVDTDKILREFSSNEY